MASTGIFNGSTYTVMFETDGSTPVIADHVTDLSVSVSTETRDTTSKNNGGYRALLPGLYDASEPRSPRRPSDTFSLSLYSHRAC